MGKFTFGAIATSALLGLSTLGASAAWLGQPDYSAAQARMADEAYASDSYGYQSGYGPAASEGYGSYGIHDGVHATQQSTGSYASNLDLNAPNAGR